MEESTVQNVSDVDTENQVTDPAAEKSEDVSLEAVDTSQSLFPDSPVYEPNEEVDTGIPEKETRLEESEATGDPPITTVKRKLSEEVLESDAKVQKLEIIDITDETMISTQNLDDEVSEINAIEEIEEKPTTSRLHTPIQSSPKKIKRSNSVEVKTISTPKIPRSASVDITVSPSKVKINLKEFSTSESIQPISTDSYSSRPSVEFVAEIPPIKIPETIVEESSEINDSQDFHLELSPTSDIEALEQKPEIKTHYNSDPVLVKNREEILDPGKIQPTRSEGYNYSDLSSNLSQTLPKEYSKGKTTDQESTDSACSVLDSPEHLPSVPSKLISKLSNGNSSTPTEIAHSKHIEDSDGTPDFVKLNGRKMKKGKNESFRASNATTPSTISPLQNGHSLPMSTPQIPSFDIHVSHNEDFEFLSLYIVRTDNDTGIEMCKEYQRVSKKFSIDPYLGDVSVSTSPSSVTSAGMINLPNRISFASTVSTSSTSSNRTSDGAFVVPQPPRKSVSNPSVSVKGYDALMKKLHDIFSHLRDTSIDEGNRSLAEDKVSIGIQTLSSETISNGNASPDEVSKCDKATPKSSLKKTRVRGRRHMGNKTKRALLPTQTEEPEHMHGMNSPEMVPTNGDNGKMSPIKSPKDEKPLSTLVGTPKSITKLKQKRRPTSPRPATPVEKAIIKPEYPGYQPDTVVLAKWVDKRYYSGKVLEITEPNKYLIKFDDGQSKVLLDEFIIFGDMKKLPLQGQSVYALVDEEQNYEPGLVLGVEENDNGIVTYKCTTDGIDTTVMVTASELYLTEDQARSIKETSRSRSPTAPSTPRRRHNRELDLDNIIQGPRSARSRDKGNSSARKRVVSPKSPKASTSGIHFDDVPKSKYSVCKLIAPRPCLTAKYIQCLAADIRALSHGWVISSCLQKTALDIDAFVLPAGWSIIKDMFINWVPSSGKRNSTFFKDKVILLCWEQDTFVKFWERVASLAGATTRVVNEENLNMSGALALVTDCDCPHEVQNKANQDNIPLVSTTWVVQCLIEAKVLAPTSHDKFSFMYTELE
ncbi:Tumor suppressor p53-binding protein 1 [Papilio machaon]|uniref:Tumor suppressor p53-binding protein 1 n=1 Tax=Papilio machaon TaxID=76193 RepID=A0A194REE0_PAPMA|nr:Tumor suppressor p53-binding protein 1 [Papilio machaon]